MPTRRFSSFQQLEVHFVKAVLASPVMVRQYVRDATALYFAEIHNTFGSRFRLKELATSTIAQRLKQTAPGVNLMGETAPLVNTGGLRDSVKMSVSGNTGRVGTNDERMGWHELGSSKYPPRPVFRQALNKTLITAWVVRTRVVPRILGERV